MTKAELIEQVMERFRYNELGGAQRAAARRVYTRMTKQMLERLLTTN